MNLTDRVLSRISGDDAGASFMLGRVVRLSDDNEISRRNVCSVLTDSGTLFKDVLIVFPSRVSKSLPYTPEDFDSQGSRVIIGFIGNNISKPFLFGYVEDAELPIPQHSQEFSSTSTGSVDILDDGEGRITITLPNKSTRVKVRLQGEDSVFDINSEGLIRIEAKELEQDSEKLSVSAVNLEEDIDTVLSKRRTEQSSLEELKQTIKTLTQEIETLRTKVDLQESEIKKLKVKGNSLILDYKSVSISGESPSDAPVLSNQLQQILTDLITAITSMSVICSAPGSPSSPPVNTPQFSAVLAKLSLMKSKFIKID